MVSESKTGLPYYSSNTDSRPKLSNNIINHKVAFEVESILYLWDLPAKKHVINIYNKLHVNSRAQAMHLAYEKGLL